MQSAAGSTARVAGHSVRCLCAACGALAGRDGGGRGLGPDQTNWGTDLKALPPHGMQGNLYEEDVKDKARAANCIATLFRQAQHLEPLLSHATLLPTLARVLRDDGKRSVDLCMGIQSVWLVLSNFSQFHQLLIENQVGVLAIHILDLEIKRTEHRVKVLCLLVCCWCHGVWCIGVVGGPE